MKHLLLILLLTVFAPALHAATEDPAAKADTGAKNDTATTSEEDFGAGCGPVKQTEAEKSEDKTFREIADKARQHRASDGKK